MHAEVSYKKTALNRTRPLIGAPVPMYVHLPIKIDTENNATKAAGVLLDFYPAEFPRKIFTFFFAGVLLDFYPAEFTHKIFTFFFL